MSKKRDLKEIGPLEAYKIIQENPRAVLIDIRSSMEFLFVGHPAGAVHIPWIDEPDWVINPQFASQIRKLMLGGVGTQHPESDAPIILICRSGKRSREAGEFLLEQGLSEVYNVTEGFEGDLDEHHHRSTLGGWRFHNLPWEQC